MGDDSVRPERKAGEPELPKIKAENNPWYLLATLYGVGHHYENRRTWNRYFAANLSLNPEERSKLFAENRYLVGESAHFTPEEEQRRMEEAFANRCKHLGKTIALPSPHALIDFSKIQFDQAVSFEGFLFTLCSFDDATFEHGANFHDTTFSENASFVRTSSLLAGFNDAQFFGQANFQDAIFLHCSEF